MTWQILCSNIQRLSYSHKKNVRGCIKQWYTLLTFVWGEPRFTHIHTNKKENHHKPKSAMIFYKSSKSVCKT